MKRALLFVLPLILACASSGTPSEEEGAFFNIRNRNFYPAVLSLYCDGLEMPPRIRAYTSRTRRVVDVSRCNSVGWIATLVASGDSWAVRGVHLQNGDALEIVLASTLRYSYFRFL